MNIWHDINPDRISRSSYSAVIEISKGSKMKYELDKETGLLRSDDGEIFFARCAQISGKADLESTRLIRSLKSYLQ